MGRCRIELSRASSIVSWINKWYIDIYWRYNRQKHHLIITNPQMEWQEGCGMVFYGVPLVDVVFERF